MPQGEQCFSPANTKIPCNLVEQPLKPLFTCAMVDLVCLSQGSSWVWLRVAHLPQNTQLKPESLVLRWTFPGIYFARCFTLFYCHYSFPSTYCLCTSGTYSCRYTTDKQIQEPCPHFRSYRTPQDGPVLQPWPWQSPIFYQHPGNKRHWTDS